MCVRDVCVVCVCTCVSEYMVFVCDVYVCVCVYVAGGLFLRKPNASIQRIYNESPDSGLGESKEPEKCR